MNCYTPAFTRGLIVCFGVACAGSTYAQSRGVQLWAGYGGNAQHTADSKYGGGQLNVIKWQTPVDTNPTYHNNDLLIHYGEPGITAQSNVVITCRHGDGSPFTVEAHRGADGGLIWSYTSTYVLPTADWTPSMGLALFPGKPSFQVGAAGLGGSSTVAAWPESGGRIGFRTDADLRIGRIKTHAFYGDANYQSNSASMDANVQVCTPLTAGPDGSVYFGYFVSGVNALGLSSGLAVVRPDGTGAAVDVATLSGNDGGIDRVAFNSAPALTPDGKTAYVAVAAGAWGRGYLVSVDTQTLAPIARIQLLDPSNQKPASVVSDGTASPTVAPDGSVFFGVLENVYASNNDRGWLLHYSGDLTQTLTPGEFGWDFTPSIVPASFKPDGSASSYYIACKYNNYVNLGSGDGQNKVAILDPSLTQTDTVTGTTVMQEVETVLGQTLDPAGGSKFPNAVREWCINSIAIDIPNETAIVNSEDGWCYAWNLATGQLTSKIQLTAGIGEAYTSTVIAPNGNVFAISNGILFAINTK
ncbi:MAG: TolB-like translocation protein [Fimbriimonadaceae bacterium]